jgi:hypothetical protein
MGAQLHDLLREQCRAGWMTAGGEVETFSFIDGPKSFRFEVTSPAGRTFVFDSTGQVAMAIYQAGGDVSDRMSSEQAVALLCAGAAYGQYRAAARHAAATVMDDRPHVYSSRRYEAALGLADRIVCLTRHADRFPQFPHWHPAWRVDELDDTTAVPAPRDETSAVTGVVVSVRTGVA